MAKSMRPRKVSPTLDKDMAALAVLVLAAAVDANMPIAEIAEKLRVSAIAVYKWLNGSPMSAPSAFVIVVKMQHRVTSIRHKKQRDQATRLLKAVKSDLSAEV